MDDTTLVAINAFTSVSIVFIVGRVQERREIRSWRRDRRLTAVLNVKMAVSSIRASFSLDARGGQSPAAKSWDFAEVNSALAEVELVGPPEAVDAVKRLRGALRVFVRAATERDASWKNARDRLDLEVDGLVDAVRGAL